MWYIMNYWHFDINCISVSDSFIIVALKKNNHIKNFLCFVISYIAPFFHETFLVTENHLNRKTSATHNQQKAKVSILFLP